MRARRRGRVRNRKHRYGYSFHLHAVLEGFSLSIYFDLLPYSHSLHLIKYIFLLVYRSSVLGTIRLYYLCSYYFYVPVLRHECAYMCLTESEGN